jgi:putative acetyltransferase
LSDWSTPVDQERIHKYITESFPEETTLVADIDGEIAGFGAIVESDNELRAVYVSSKFGGLGIGTKLLSELEKVAEAKGCTELQMVSSLTAEPFYKRNGYNEIGRGIHTLRSGKKMACVKMRKTLI